MNALRVLHVDDEPDIREVVEMSLALDPDLSVKSCACGSDALSAAAEWSPDLILMDVMMPQMDGPQTLSRLRARQQTAKIPVVFMTARAQTRELQHFLSLGAAGVIPKPFDPMTLAGAVRGYLKADISLDGLRQKFIARARADAEKLAQLAEADVAAGVYAGIATIAHALSGAAGTHGFASVSASARSLEDCIDRWSEGEAMSAEVHALLANLLEVLSRDIPASG